MDSALLLCLCMNTCFWDIAKEALLVVRLLSRLVVPTFVSHAFVAVSFCAGPVPISSHAETGRLCSRHVGK